DVLAVARPGGAARAHARDLDAVRIDVADPAARELLAGRDAGLPFAGVPDPAGARRDPAGAVRANAGTTLNLLEAGVPLVYPSSVRAGLEPPPDAYAMSKRLGEEACRLHATSTIVVRLPSVFGPGQVAWEGATGAIAAFAARALDGEPIVIPGDPQRTRDFVYVDDVVLALERLVADGRWGESLAITGETPTPLLRAAELVLAAAGSEVAIDLPGGELPPGAHVGGDRLDDEARAGIERSAHFAAGVGSPVLTIHLFIPMDPAEYRAHAGVDEEAVRAFLRFYADACLAHGVTPLIENVPPVLRMRTGGVFLSPVGGHWEDLLAWRARVPELGFTIDTSHAALFRSFAAAYPSPFGLESDEGLELERYVEELGPAAEVAHVSDA